MSDLGALLVEHGELEEAETWFRKAIAAGDSDAMNNLSELLNDRDRG